jgi:hypothetical protein
LPEWLPGAFVVVPRITTGTEYNSNIFASPIRPIADQISFVTPGLSIASRWARHAVTADVEVSYRNYLKSDLDVFDYKGQLGAVFDVNRRFAVGFDVNAYRQHDTFFVDNLPVDVVFGNRDLPTNLAGLIPVQQTIESAWVRYASYRLVNVLTAAHETVDYGNAPAIGGGTVDLSFRDWETFGLYNRTELALSHRLRFYFDLFARKREYSNNQDRDSTQLGTAGKVEFAVTPLVFVDLAGAYSTEDFNTGVFDSGPTRSVYLGATWFPRSYLKVRVAGGVGEEGQNFDQASSSGKFTRVDAGLDYGFARSWNLSAFASYFHADRTSFIGPRVDDDYIARLRLDYNFWRNSFVGLLYDYRLNKSSDIGNVERQIVRLEVKSRF